MYQWTYRLKDDNTSLSIHVIFRRGGFLVPNEEKKEVSHDEPLFDRERWAYTTHDTETDLATWVGMGSGEIQILARHAAVGTLIPGTGEDFLPKVSIGDVFRRRKQRHPEGYDDEGGGLVYPHKVRRCPAAKQIAHAPTPDGRPNAIRGFPSQDPTIHQTSILDKY